MRYGIVVTVAALLLAGCGALERPDANAEKPDCQHCIKTRSIVTYHENDSSYWTEQQQRFCPATVVFAASGSEPEGAWRGTLSEGRFATSGLDGSFMQSLPFGLMDAVLAEMLYYSFTAGANFEPEAVTPLEPASIEGRRYASFRVDRQDAGHTVTLYRDVATGRIELVRLAAGDGRIWQAQSYNLRYNPRFERMMPRKVDIFDIRRGIAAKKLLVEFDYIDVQ